MAAYDALPVYDERMLGQLRPVTSLNRGRYDRPYDNSLPSDWTQFIHPEGQPYFYRRGGDCTVNVVTESWVKKQETLARLVLFIAQIERMLSANNIPIHPALELFIQVKGEGCGYYLVDHNVRTTFWVHEQSTGDLGIWDVVSTTHLDILRTQLYWVHVEHFPMHFGSEGIGRGCLNELVSVLAHARVDRLTSLDSTFPYSVEKCGQFLEILNMSKGIRTTRPSCTVLVNNIFAPDNFADGNTICLVAHIPPDNRESVEKKPFIDLNRQLHLHGEEHCRLSRSQAIIHDPATKHAWVSVVAACLSFSFSTQYVSKLDSVYVDKLTYEEHWKALVEGCLRDWKDVSRGALMGLLLHIILVVVNLNTNLAVVSAGLLGSSILVARLLIYRYTLLQSISAGEIVVALVFALPQALQLWGLLVFLVNCGIIFALYFGIVPTAVVLTASALVGWMIMWTTSAEYNSLVDRIAAFLKPGMSLRKVDEVETVGLTF
ncbi:hypothetical protein C8R43DRAFT_1195561 [Mycena crocata]|nr:hypothetical protein C8R43DRAFT_1195561 [Mycena crocata]